MQAQLSGEQIQQIARQTAENLPDVTHGYPFTKSLNVYKVVDKVFLIVTEDPDELIITVKADPHRAESLRRSFESIQPGRYLNKRHWISIGSGTGITADIVDDLVAGSYELAGKKRASTV
ncbi:MmcQ/YjbR family DNA-binding protein [Leifsonia sp. A12D58]|uniref:MmcQ/YjbR family DNA-binding protein n=1 Tax=Leifsonia sp. A12D58 TaxID=3397674 RepID=UPI0039E10125